MAEAFGPEVKAGVLADLAGGKSVRATAKAHGVSETTVRGWRSGAGLSSAPLGPEKKADLGELVYGLVEESINTMVAQLRFARDPAWLARQNAADLAVLFGVTADKATRLLAAFRPANPDPGDDPPHGTIEVAPRGGDRDGL